MRKTITRSIPETTIKSTTVKLEGGKASCVPNIDLILNGSYTEEKALKVVQKEFGINALVVEVTEKEQAYEISVDDFMKYAKKVDKEVEETKEKAEDKTEINGGL